MMIDMMTVIVNQRPRRVALEVAATSTSVKMDALARTAFKGAEDHQVLEVKRVKKATGDAQEREAIRVTVVRKG
jgi:hypothetical protein